MPLHPHDKESVIERYKNRIMEHGTTLDSMSSGSIEKQKLRHKIHASALKKTPSSVLDVGCGIGLFRHYLSSLNYQVSYTGYDLISEYIDICKAKYPKDTFKVHNIFEEGITSKFDTIVLSQVLNNRYKESSNMEVMKFTLQQCFKHSNVSVSIDMMSKYVDYEHPDVFYYDPCKIFDMARAITKRVTIRHDYRPYEFCIQLFHDDVDGYIP